jgi:hypothetical protein
MRLYCAKSWFLAERDYRAFSILPDARRAGIQTRRIAMKKIGFLTLLVTATLLLTLALPVSAAGPNAVPAVGAAAVPASPAVVAPPAPPHPHIHEALEAMRAAKHHLESAVPEYHGHRAKAIEHLDAAIHEAEICEQEP